MGWSAGRTGLTERVPFEQRPEGAEGGGPPSYLRLRKRIPGGGNSKCKGPEAGPWPKCSGNSQEASVARADNQGNVRRDWVGEQVFHAFQAI